HVRGPDLALVDQVQARPGQVGTAAEALVDRFHRHRVAETLGGPDRFVGRVGALERQDLDAVAGQQLEALVVAEPTLAAGLGLHLADDLLGALRVQAVGPHERPGWTLAPRGVARHPGQRRDRAFRARVRRDRSARRRTVLRP